MEENHLKSKKHPPCSKFTPFLHPEAVAQHFTRQQGSNNKTKYYLWAYVSKYNSNYRKKTSSCESLKASSDLDGVGLAPVL